MYSGLDKYGGDVVGKTSSTECTTATLEETIENASAEETIVVNWPQENGEVVKLLLQSQLNPEGGGLMWIQVEDTTSTYSNVVSMSQMTSMLRDHDRNRKYAMGITEAIQRFVEKNGRSPKVLDIGTGTGLLSMIAASNGAESVTACELFPAMAAAAKVITQTNVPGKITVIPKKSTDLTVGSCSDMQQKADLLVSEIFDSALLGEGVIPTIRHALQHLLVENADVVPGKASMFAQLVESEDLHRFHSLRGSTLCPNVHLFRDETASNCNGGKTILPLHISELPLAPKPLSSEFKVFEIDFRSKEEMDKEIESFVTQVDILKKGNVHGVLFWWEIQLTKDITYSTKANVENWQDHWTQAFFPCGDSLGVEENDQLYLTTTKKDYTVHFRVDQEQFPKIDPFEDVCKCGFHLLCNSERIKMLNDLDRNQAIYKAISNTLKIFTNDPVCVDISDGSTCALMAAGCGAKWITSIESKSFSALLSEQVAAGNNFSTQLIVLEAGCKGLHMEHLNGEKKIDILMGEPFYYSMQNMPLLQALNFWYRRTAMNDLLQQNCNIIPSQGILKAVAVELKNLHESFGNVGSVLEFDHSHLDSLQEGWHRNDFPFPLWMYPHRHLSKVANLLVMDFTNVVTSSTLELSLPFTQSGTCHGIIMWVDYQLDDENSISTGLDKNGRPPQHCKQVLRFLPTPKCVTVDNCIHFQADFSATDAKFSLALNVV